MQQLPVDTKPSQGKGRQRNPVQRALSVPDRRNHNRMIKRQASNEELQAQDFKDQEHVFAISSPDVSTQLTYVGFVFSDQYLI